MARLPSRSILLFSGAVLAAAPIAGCLDDSSTVAAIASPALLTADPTTFRGTLRCGAPELAKYVVTLTEVSASPPALLPSSLPVPCTTVASFEATSNGPIKVGSFYTAAIDGYDRDDIHPQESGSRTMLDATNEVVAQRWTTTCGELPPPAAQDADVLEGGEADVGLDEFNPLRYPTQVLGATDVILRGCSTLREGDPSDAGADAGTEERADATSQVQLSPGADAASQ